MSCVASDLGGKGLAMGKKVFNSVGCALRVSV